MVIVWIINFGSWNFIYYLEFLSGYVEMEFISFLVVYYTYCFLTATMVRRIRLIVKLYVHCLSFFIVAPCIMESIYCSLTNKCTFY